MSSSLELRDYQRASVDWLRARLRGHRRAIVAHPPGLGKTIIAAKVIRAPALVVCPASLVLNWRRELERWRPDLDEDDVNVVSYEKMTKLNVSARHPYRSFVLDEAHFIKNHEAMRTRVACRFVRSVGREGRVVALSGTLVPNRPIELWPLMYAMRVTQLEYDAFARHYAAAWTNQWGALDVSGARNLSELRDLLAPHCIRYEKEEVLSELPPKEWRVLALDLPVDRREKRMRKELLRKTEHPIPREAISDVLRQHGIRKLPLAVEHVRSVLDGEDGRNKVLVFAHHRDVVTGLMRELREYGLVSVVGGMTAEQKQTAVDAFQRRRTIRVFVGQLQAAGVGLNLTAANRVVLVEASWVPAENEQAVDRAHRIGTKDSVLVDVLTIHRSVDEHVLRRSLEKKEVVDQIVASSPFTSDSKRPSIFD